MTALSPWLLAALLIDRFLSIKFHVWAKVHCTKKTTWIVGAIIIILVFLINSHMLFYLKRTEVYTPLSFTNQSLLVDVRCQPAALKYIVFWQSVWPAILFVLFSFGPIICLITCSVIIVKTISERKNFRRTRRQEEVRSLTKLQVAVCVVFITISLPVCSYLIISPYIFDESSLYDISRSRLVWTCVALLLYCNNAFNFVIYCLRFVRRRTIPTITYNTVKFENGTAVCNFTFQHPRQSFVGKQCLSTLSVPPISSLETPQTSCYVDSKFDSRA